ncbi:caspase family protein [Providencia rettgeri]
MADLLLSSFFQKYQSPKKNIDLINHFHYLNNHENFNDLKTEDIKKIPFILDHKEVLCIPQQICFPSVEDTKWNVQTTTLSFVHEDIQIWLRNKPAIKNWLESLGVTEKTDTTYIEQIIIPNIKTYITNENAISAIQDLFRLYEKGDLKKDLIERLSTISLLTKNGSLKPANECHLSNFYEPRFAIEEILDFDIFVNNKYCIDENNRSSWKHFFKMMGVKESTTIISYQKKINKNDFINVGYKSDYFNSDDKKFKPFQSTFSADTFSNITTINYIEVTQVSIKFSFEFWKDFIANNEPSEISNNVTAFWGHEGKAGRINGDQVSNYIPWYIKNIACIPAIDGNCYSSPNIFLNTQEIIDIGGNYLPVFDDIELSPDWRSFFSFKTQLKLEDYLSILNKISKDIKDDGVMKKANTQRLNLIYKDLLNQCINWGEDEIEIVKKWSESNKLLNTCNQFTECNSLKYFIDGNESIFQDQFPFISLNAENRQHSNLETLLNNFSIQILRQSDFELITLDKSESIELKEHLKNIMPYFRIWIEHDVNNDTETFRKLGDLQSNINILNINHATELKIQYSEINFTKNTNVHFDQNEIYVTKPWNSNSVLLTLSTQLCRFLGLQGHDKKLDFLLRSKIDEIQKYFFQENISVPDEVLNQHISHDKNIVSSTSSYTKPSSFDTLSAQIKNKKVPTDYYHMSEADFEKLQYVESIISRSVENVIKHLNTLNGYDCSNHYEIAKSIIGGVKKYGHEITIVARPSDNNQVLLFYTSEFDVLSHVDAEFWCEDGTNPPKQIRMGQLLNQTGINRIPIKHMSFSIEDIESNLKTKSQSLDFDAIPFTPEKTARIMASFANTDGGKIVFGLKENSTDSTEVVGLSKDFDVMDIVQKSISMLSPTPTVNYEWINIDEKNIFLIEVEKQDNQNILFNNAIYIRKGIDSILEKESINKPIINTPNIERTFAIIISIENYAVRDKNTIPKVKYASNDALAFKDILTNKMNVSEDDIYFINDNKALKSDLEYELRGILYQLKENDRLIFYYAGHGFHNGITNILTTYDSHPYNLSHTSVSLRDILLDPLQKSHCKNALIFIDSCAEHLQTENQRNGIFSINDEQFRLITTEFPSYSVFLSCQTGEKSYSCDSLEHGVWTYYLIDALSRNEHAVITDNSLRDYLSINVSQYVKNKLGYDQNPKAILESGYENVIF